MCGLLCVGVLDDCLMFYAFEKDVVPENSRAPVQSKGYTEAQGRRFELLCECVKFAYPTCW